MANATEEALLDGPAIPPPPGESVDFNEVGYLMRTFPVLALIIIAPTLLLMTRLYTKFVLIRKSSPEDYICIIAYVFFIVFLAVGDAAGLKVGGNRHLWNVRLRDFMTFQLYSYISLLLYAMAIFLVKLSILMQIMRIFTPNKLSKLWKAIYITIAVNFFFYIAILFHAAFLCSPTEKFWSPFMKGECMDLGSTYITSAAFSAFTDIVILILPLHATWRLQMATKQKLAVSAVFLIGFCACACSIAQIYFAVLFAQTKDVTYALGRPTGRFSQCEIAIGLICSCLPVTPRFFQTYYRRASAWRQRSISAASQDPPTSPRPPSVWSSWRTRASGGGKRSSPLLPTSTTSNSSHVSTWHRASSVVFDGRGGKGGGGTNGGGAAAHWWDGAAENQILRTVEIEAVESPKHALGRPVSPPGDGDADNIAVAPWSGGPAANARRQVWCTVRTERPDASQALAPSDEKVLLAQGSKDLT